jgi:hypothetical protein
MKEQVRKEILYSLTEAIRILENREIKDAEELKNLSDHSVEDLAVYKDIDLISVTVMIYSLYKVVISLSPANYDKILKQLIIARRELQNESFGEYNRSLKRIYNLLREGGGIKEHLQDVMQAARIKKGTVLLSKGLSIGQAAGLMGLSNWDLQEYASKTPVLEEPLDMVSTKKRMERAMELFDVK